MASVSARGRRRRAMNEINMVPFIDVMLVLLIIFMVSAPLITASTVDLPSVGRAQARPKHVVEVIIDADGALKARVDGGTPTALASNAVAARVREMQAGDATTPVVISADKGVRYEAVVKVMDTLQRAGVQRVGLSVRQAANPS